MRIIPDASAESLHGNVSEHIEPGATVITDGWQGYAGIESLGYHREKRSQRAVRLAGGDPHGLLPGVHRSHRIAGEALAAQHAPGLGRRGTPAGVLGRVRVPLQPPKIA